MGHVTRVKTEARAIAQSRRLQSVHARVAEQMQNMLVALTTVQSQAQLQGMVVRTAALLARINKDCPEAKLLPTLAAFRWDMEKLDMKQEAVNDILEDATEETADETEDVEDADTIAEAALEAAALQAQALMTPGAAGQARAARGRGAAPQPSDRMA